MKKFQILGFFITSVSLSILKMSSKSETWSPESVRFAMEHTISRFGIIVIFSKLLDYIELKIGCILKILISNLLKISIFKPLKH